MHKTCHQSSAQPAKAGWTEGSLQAVDPGTSITLKVQVSPTSFELTLRGDCAVAIVEAHSHVQLSPLTLLCGFRWTRTAGAIPMAVR